MPSAPEIEKLNFDSIHDYQGLLDHIRYINKAFYEPAARNIEYLERHFNINYPVHTIALRDAYSHLAKIFEYNILAADGKIRIKRQLERYLGHLEELLYDTYLKIIKLKSERLTALYTENNRGIGIPRIKTQLAPKVQKIRNVDDKTSITRKKAAYKGIVDFLDNSYKI